MDWYRQPENKDIRDAKVEECKELAEQMGADEMKKFPNCNNAIKAQFLGTIGEEVDW
ncbi:MAG: hypothetical protein IJD04_03620 [Desulfovibrionaceae bacterium]|nr:hypothetical protein [Desulfovibrionaceae bacterium]